MIKEAESFLTDKKIRIAISGSAGMGVAQVARLQFVQEVYATFALVEEKEKDTEVVIELGG